MDDHFIVSTNGPWYDQFSNLTFIVTIIILIHAGIKRRFPFLRWLLLLIFARFLFIIGTKVFIFSFEAVTVIYGWVLFANRFCFETVHGFWV